MLRHDPFVCIILWFCFIIGISANNVLSAQDLLEAQKVRRQRLQMEVQKVMDIRATMAQRLLWDWGGSERFMFLTYDDIDNNRVSDKRRTMRTNNLYLWGNLNLDDIHNFYLRFHVQQIDRNAGDQYRSHENEFAFVMEDAFDQGTYTLSIDKALKKYLKFESPVQMDLTAGRFRSYIGKQIAYMKNANGIQLDGSSKWVDFKLFGFRNLIHEENIDYSVPGFRHSKRFFYGAEFRYKGFKEHRPYIYALIQEDDSGENIEDVNQDYEYNSRYYGIGSRGRILKKISYEIEGILEDGKSFPDAAVARGFSPDNEQIEAWAFDATLSYRHNIITQPTFSAQYALASGDPDRTARVTNTIGGNKEGSTDRSFLGFGYTNTGFSLAARMANLRMVKLGFAFTPSELVKNNKVNMEANYYLFSKDEKQGAISDTRADRPQRNIGKEFDINIRWEIFSDLSASINYGRFYPGNAYSDKDARDFVMFMMMFQF